jgi:uncharacterized protein YbjT (DUF2867 family)
MFLRKVTRSNHGIKRVVMLLTMGTGENASFTIGRLYYKTEEAIKDSGIKCTFLQDFLRLAGDTIRNKP